MLRDLDLGRDSAQIVCLDVGVQFDHKNAAHYVSRHVQGVLFPVIEDEHLLPPFANIASLPIQDSPPVQGLCGKEGHLHVVENSLEHESVNVLLIPANAAVESPLARQLLLFCPSQLFHKHLQVIVE